MKLLNLFRAVSFWGFVLIAGGYLLSLGCNMNIGPCNDCDPPLLPVFVPNKMAASFFAQNASLEIEVAYEEGAKPYVGNLALNPSGTKTDPNNWDIIEDNLKEIFKNKTVANQLTIPKTESEMKAVPAQNKSSWTTDKILAFAEAHTRYKQVSSGFIFLVFLKGYFEGKNNILGVSLGSTSVVAIFKDVVEASGQFRGPRSLELFQKTVELSTVVHELGHALGLVNNGIPMTTAHQDSNNGAHCTNTECVMYWAIESNMSEMVKFANKRIDSDARILFQSECLSDAQNFNP
ncbi:MAG: hypothetical protein HYY62_01150 [Deltaproteobacteria bacterium]|nr:hypothetical protein [Deltaproteobacteria bacterium]